MPIGIVNRSTVFSTPSFDKKIQDFLKYKFYNDGKIIKVIEDIEKDIKKYLTEIIKKTTLYKGLNGSSELDLGAEFGLYDEQLKDVQNGIVEILINTIHSSLGQISSESRNGIKFNVNTKAFDEFEYIEQFSEEPFDYVSINKKGDSHDVPWMKWVLDPLDTILDGIGIVFDDFDAESRSGRAKMTKNAKDADIFPYKIPAQLIPTEGKNFIEEIGINRDVKDRIKEIVYDNLVNSGLFKKFGS